MDKASKIISKTSTELLVSLAPRAINPSNFSPAGYALPLGEVYSFSKERVDNIFLFAARIEVRSAEESAG